MRHSSQQTLLPRTLYQYFSQGTQEFKSQIALTSLLLPLDKTVTKGVLRADTRVKCRLRNKDDPVEFTLSTLGVIKIKSGKSEVCNTRLQELHVFLYVSTSLTFMYWRLRSNVANTSTFYEAALIHLSYFIPHFVERYTLEHASNTNSAWPEP
jgi:hypothetical protein